MKKSVCKNSITILYFLSFLQTYAALTVGVPMENRSCLYCMHFSFKLTNSLEGLLCQNKSVSIIYILLRNILPYISRKLIRAKNIVLWSFLNRTQPFYWHSELSLVESDDSFRAKHLNLYLIVEQALKKQYSHVSK